MAVVVCGRKHTGKSTFLNDFGTKANQKTKKKVLVIDVNGAPAYKQHQLLNERQFITWCKDAKFGGVKRFYLSDNERMFKLIIENFRSGLVIFEDCTKYIKASPSDSIKTFLVDHRMWDTDLMFTFHSLKRVPLFFWEMTTHLILFKTQDVIDSENDRFFLNRIPDFRNVYKLYKRVKDSKDNYINGSVELLE